MKIDILCSSDIHPVNKYIVSWCHEQGTSNECTIQRTVEGCVGGDILVLVSCSEIVKQLHRKKYRHSIVLHASDLPRNRGWSPYIWEILEGADKLTLSVLTAADPVDSGEIWKKLEIPLNGTETYELINEKLFSAEMLLMSWFVDNCDIVRPYPQTGEATFCRRRTPEDSRLDPQKTIAEQFNLLRVCDPERYPAFFEFRGTRYRIRIETDEAKV